MNLEKESKRGTATVDGLAMSQSPRPDYLYGTGGRECFLGELSYICASAFLQSMNRDGYNERAGENRQRIAGHLAEEYAQLRRSANVEARQQRSDSDIIGEVQYLDVVREEVNRRIALGVPPNINRDDLTGVAHFALVEAYIGGVYAVRLKVRGALLNLLGYESVRRKFRADMPCDITTSSQRSDIVALSRALTIRHSEAVSLVYFHGYSQAEAGVRMGCSQRTICSLLKSSSKYFRAELLKSAA